jgi:hypothetical protein
VHIKVLRINSYKSLGAVMAACMKSGVLPPVKAFSFQLVSALPAGA